MKLALKWKLLPLAAIAALGIVALAPGASANVESVTVVGSDTVASGGSVEIGINAEFNDGNLTVSIAGLSGTSTAELELTDCSGCSDEGDTGSSLNVTTATFPANGNVVVTLTLTCTANDTVTITATQDGVSGEDTASCTPASATATATATVTGTPGTATPTVTTTPTGDVVTIVAVPTNPPCGSPSFIFATVRNAAGAPLNGQTVVFTSTGNVGTFNPASGMTGVDGVASTTYTPPATGTQSITVTATANGKSASTVITTSCTTVAATNTPVPATPISQVKPPSTGDAGLVGGGDSPLYAGLALLIGLTFTGGLVLARRRA